MFRMLIKVNGVGPKLALTILSGQSAEEFHRCIAEASGNSAIVATVTWLWSLRHDSEISTHFHQRLRREGAKPIVSDHRAIFTALQKGDPEAARSAMSNHLQRVIDDLMANP